MRLEPIAKPIRIRIKLGNSEYSSLDSVKSNFSIEELFPLFKDGRLERWLMQIGEVQLANDTNKLSKRCGDGDIEDYVKFLSLFYDEVANSLTQYQNDAAWSFTDYLSTASLDSIRIVYTKTKDVESIDWLSHIDGILSKDNAFALFEDAQLHSVYDNGDWGIKLSGLVKTENDYREIFKFLGTEIKKHPDPEYQNILLDFYFAAYNNGYVWASIFGSEDLDFFLEWYSNSYFTKKCKQDWKTIIRPHLTIENIKDFFESDYSDIFKGSFEEEFDLVTDEGTYNYCYWGEEFANLVTDEGTYKELFTYLENYSRNSQQPDRCKDIISTFYSILYKKGYQWTSIFKHELTIEYLSDLYQNECIQILNIDWGKLFADCVTDWERDSKIIESVIRSNGRDVISFYNRCVEKGYEEAKLKLDPWYVLANSDDYPYVKKALDEWDGERRHYKRENYNYINILSPLGQQILDFLQSLIDLRGKDGFWGYDRYYGCEYYLEDDKQVMIDVSNRYRNSSGWLTFTNQAMVRLIDMRMRGVVIAGHAIINTQGYKAEESYLEIARYEVNLIAKRLREQRVK